MRSLESRIYKVTKEADNEITEDQEQGSRGAYALGSSICVLGAERTSIHLLPRGEECTRVYTVVYPRVHNCVHACTLPRSKYHLCRVLS